MKTLIIATSKKPPNFEQELTGGQRYRLEYLDLSTQLSASYLDYDPPWIHEHSNLRQIEEKLHFDFFWARSIAKMVNQEGYEVVMSMSERIAVPLANLLNGQVKHIALFINTQSTKWLTAINLLQAHKKWDKIITYSYTEAETLQRKLNLGPDVVQGIHNYVDTNFFHPMDETQQDVEHPFILSQGLANRDYPTLIRAMRTLPHVVCHISAVSAWDKFKAGYEGMDIPDNVLLKSYNHPSIIRDTMAKCRIFVITLRPDAGMWCAGSTSVLQAQAMGKPVIVTYLPGIAEYLQDGKTGFLVEGNNPAALAEKIDYLWQNPQRAAEMGKYAQKWVRENFSLETWVEKISRLVTELS